MRATLLAEAVVRAEPTWKMKTAFGSPSASRVSVPVSPIEEDAVYTPAVRVRPPRSPETLDVEGAPAAALYAVVRSVWACRATASATCWAPFTVPGGNPVTALPGLRPRSPVITLGPVLVTVVPARTAKLSSVPRFGAVAATAGWAAMNMAIAPAAATGPAASHA
jgi:hypothetical protein